MIRQRMIFRRLRTGAVGLAEGNGAMAQENSHLSSPTGALPTLGTGAAMLRWVARAQGPLIGLVVLCVLFASTSPVFLSVRNALNIIDQVTVLGILAIGMTAVIVIGGIDLSAGAILALATMTIGSVWRDFAPPFVVCIALGLIAGALAGLVNGLLVTRARLPAFIATLTMMSVARGLANITTDGEQVVGFPDWFTALSTVRHFGALSFTVALFVVLAAAAFIFLRFRATGRALYAIGGSAEARAPRPHSCAAADGARLRRLRPAVRDRGRGAGRPGRLRAAERRPGLRARHHRRGRDRAQASRAASAASVAPSRAC